MQRISSPSVWPTLFRRNCFGNGKKNWKLGENSIRNPGTLRRSTSIKRDFRMRVRSGSIKAMANASFASRRLRQRLPAPCVISTAIVMRSTRSWLCQITSTSWCARMTAAPCLKSCILGNRSRQKKSTSSGGARELFGRTRITIEWCAILRSWSDIAATSKEIPRRQSWAKGNSFWSRMKMPEARRLLAPQTRCPRHDSCPRRGSVAQRSSVFRIGSWRSQRGRRKMK